MKSISKISEINPYVNMSLSFVGTTNQKQIPKIMRGVVQR